MWLTCASGGKKQQCADVNHSNVGVHANTTHRCAIVARRLVGCAAATKVTYVPTAGWIRSIIASILLHEFPCRVVPVRLQWWISRTLRQQNRKHFAG